jgi:hypothetical protein
MTVLLSPRETLNKSSGSRRWRCGLSPRGVASYARWFPCTRRHNDADHACGNDAVGCRRCSSPAPCGLRRNRALASALATSVSCRASWHCGMCQRAAKLFLRSSRFHLQRDSRRLIQCFPSRMFVLFSTRCRVLSAALHESEDC